MNESDYIWVLVSSKIEKFKVDIFDIVKDFYKKFDITESLSRQPILDLITCVNVGLDSVLKEIKK